MILYRMMLLGISAVMLTACATTEQVERLEKAEPSGFLEDYAVLRPDDNGTGVSLVYFTPDKARFRSYTKIMLDPVQVWREEDAKAINVEDAQHLSQYLWSRVSDELRKDYTLVQQAGPEVMRVRISVTEAGKGTPLLDNLTARYPDAVIVSQGKKALSGTQGFVARTSIEMEAIDSQTDELLAASVDRRGGGKYAQQSMKYWEDVEQAFHYWAKKLRWRVCEMRGDASCEKPED